MFKNEFQGGSFFDIFNPSVKDPLSNFKVTGSNGIQKIYDKDIKSSVYQLEGIPTTTKITLPKDSRQGLSLVQKNLVFQLFIKPNQEFSLEIGVTDLSQNRRILSFSTSHKEVSVQPFSARVPIKHVNRAQWTNLVFDLASVIAELWKSQTSFKTIDLIAVCANCRLRKIFTVKTPPNYDQELNELVFDDMSLSGNFPEGTNTKIQMISLGDSSLPDQLDSPKTASQKASKQGNVFKIAFGSKVPNSTQLNSSQSQRKLQSQLNTSNLNDQSDMNLSGSFKNNQISPLSMSAGTSGQKRKSVSDFNLTDKSAVSESRTSKNTEIKDENKMNSSRSVKSSSNSSATAAAATAQSSLSKSNATTSLNSSRIEGATAATNSSTSDKLNDVLTTQPKIPYPPPQSTRPLSSRKIIRSAKPTVVPVKQPEKQQPQVKPTDPVDTEPSNMINLDDSINDIIQVLKANGNQSSDNNKHLINDHPVNKSNFNEITNLDDSSRTIVYTFSSKPKPVISAPAVNVQSSPKTAENGTKSNQSKGEYDHRKYLNKPQANTNALLSKPASFSPTLISSGKNGAIKNLINGGGPISDLNNNDVMDSFEARMLQDMKAEMDADRDPVGRAGNSNTGSKKSGSDGGSSNQTSSGGSNAHKTKSTGSNLSQGTDARLDCLVSSPDLAAAHIEELQRESSGLQSPLSDDRTTSEKYNFDVMTSSIDDTTTSISKKTTNRKNNDANNYQEEMNNSLLSNLPAKSINFKELPAKYSPFNQHPNGSSKLGQNPISEEPSQYDDSQADIDEIISDSDEEVDLLFDPALNCYYDPKTCTYYELNIS